MANELYRVRDKNFPGKPGRVWGESLTAAKAAKLKELVVTSRKSKTARVEPMNAPRMPGPVSKSGLAQPSNPSLLEAQAAARAGARAEVLAAEARAARAAKTAIDAKVAAKLGKMPDLDSMLPSDAELAELGEDFDLDAAIDHEQVDLHPGVTEIPPTR